MTAPPVPCQWDGESFIPAKGFSRLCDKHFVVGERYILIEHNDRSHISHRHYFASVQEAWKNLPENLSERFPTSEHLRAYALIRTGYADSRQIVAANKTEARRIAAFIKPMNTYALVTVTDSVVTVWEARSQSYKSMPKGEFQRSKDAVLDLLAGFIGTTTSELEKNAGEAA